jgi:Glutathione S-transferase
MGKFHPPLRLCPYAPLFKQFTCASFMTTVNMISTQIHIKVMPTSKICPHQKFDCELLSWMLQLYAETSFFFFYIFKKLGGDRVIDLYTWTTPNGRKVSILLEELAVPYTVKSINIGKDEQFAPDFLALSPNNKIPAIYDHEYDISVMESGAILYYLATKHQQFIPSDLAKKMQVMEWLMWQMGGLS